MQVLPPEMRRISQSLEAALTALMSVLRPFLAIQACQVRKFNEAHLEVRWLCRSDTFALQYASSHLFTIRLADHVIM